MRGACNVWAAIGTRAQRRLQAMVLTSDEHPGTRWAWQRDVTGSLTQATTGDLRRSNEPNDST